MNFFVINSRHYCYFSLIQYKNFILSICLVRGEAAHLERNLYKKKLCKKNRMRGNKCIEASHNSLIKIIKLHSHILYSKQYRQTQTICE